MHREVLTDGISVPPVRRAFRGRRCAVPRTGGYAQWAEGGRRLKMAGRGWRCALALLLWWPGPRRRRWARPAGDGGLGASVAPAVFPFLALMPLLTCDEADGPTSALLGRVDRRCSACPARRPRRMVIGMVAGSPAGALAARRVAARSGMDRGQLHRVAVAAMGFSPAFLISGVGAGMLGSAAMGWRLALAQLLTQLTLALLLRGAWRIGRSRCEPRTRPGGRRDSRRGAGGAHHLRLHGAVRRAGPGGGRPAGGSGRRGAAVPDGRALRRAAAGGPPAADGGAGSC